MSDRYAHIRGPLQVIGPLLILAGFVMAGIGIYDFTSSFGDFDKGPGKFWMCFVGMLVLMGGIALTKIGFVGAATSYVAEETAPGVRRFFRAASRGWHAKKDAIHCTKCGKPQEPDANFCSGCGEALTQ